LKPNTGMRAKRQLKPIIGMRAKRQLKPIIGVRAVKDLEPELAVRAELVFKLIKVMRARMYINSKTNLRTV